MFRQIDKVTFPSLVLENLEKIKDDDVTINPFVKVKTSDAVTKLKRNNT